LPRHAEFKRYENFIPLSWARVICDFMASQSGSGRTKRGLPPPMKSSAAFP